MSSPQEHKVNICLLGLLTGAENAKEPLGLLTKAENPYDLV